MNFMEFSSSRSGNTITFTRNDDDVFYSILCPVVVVVTTRDPGWRLPRQAYHVHTHSLNKSQNNSRNPTPLYTTIHSHTLHITVLYTHTRHTVCTPTRHRVIHNIHITHALYICVYAVAVQ